MCIAQVQELRCFNFQESRLFKAHTLIRGTASCGRHCSQCSIHFQDLQLCFQNTRLNIKHHIIACDSCLDQKQADCPHFLIMQVCYLTAFAASTGSIPGSPGASASSHTIDADTAGSRPLGSPSGWAVCRPALPSCSPSGSTTGCESWLLPKSEHQCSCSSCCRCCCTEYDRCVPPPSAEAGRHPAHMDLCLFLCSSGRIIRSISVSSFNLQKYVLIAAACRRERRPQRDVRVRPPHGSRRPEARSSRPKGETGHGPGS